MHVLVQSISIFICMFMGLVAQIDSSFGSVLFANRRVGDVTVEGREGRTILKLWMFLDGEVNQINLEKISPFSRLFKMITALQGTNTVLWILKVKILLA